MASTIVSHKPGKIGKINSLNFDTGEMVNEKTSQVNEQHLSTSEETTAALLAASKDECEISQRGADNEGLKKLKSGKEGEYLG